MTTTSLYSWGSLPDDSKPDMVIIAYTNSSGLDAINGSLFDDAATDGQTNASSSLSSSSSSWWWSDYPSGYSWPHIISTAILITLVILVIIIGNFLVIWAIIHDRTLKVTQNWFIACLACADLCIGLLVLPFSLTNELLGYWPFGVILCEIYKAVDVLLCTASIISLCLISLDRYWSITRAVTYARQRTKKRAIIMIFTVWFISAVVCIPPLIGWNKPAEAKEWPVCMLSEDIGYVIYSASGSFFIPAFIMVFVYFKIYQAAKKRARRSVVVAKQSGCVSTDNTKLKHHNSIESMATEYHGRRDNNANCDDNVCTISVEKDKAFEGNTTEETAADTVNDTLVTTSSEDEVKTNGQRLDGNETALSSEEREPLNLRNATDSESNKDSSGRYFDRQDSGRSGFDPISSSDTESVETVNRGDAAQSPGHAATDTDTNGKPGNGSLQRFKIIELRANGTSAVADTGPANNSKRPIFASIRNSLFPPRKTTTTTNRKTKQVRAANAAANSGGDYGKCSDFLTADKQKKKLAKARERRATVVLGLVMAAFIMCWLPFFGMYLISAFCPQCIHPTVFSVFFWIGYFNSALNPIIYTVFNREFRRAFQKIIFGRKNNNRR